MASWFIPVRLSEECVLTAGQECARDTSRTGRADYGTSNGRRGKEEGCRHLGGGGETTRACNSGLQRLQRDSAERGRRRAWLFVKGDVAHGAGHAIGLQILEAEQFRVHQVRRRYVRQRREDAFHAAGEFLVPFAHQALDLLALQVFLRTAQVTWDDGEALDFRIALRVFFLHV